MARLDKIIKKMLNQPNDIDYAELRYVLLAIGCNERRGKGSHTFFPHPETGVQVSIPFQKPLRRCYIIRTIQMFDLKEVYDEITGRIS